MLVRVITSLKWQGKFEGFAKTFAKLKDDLRLRMVEVIQLAKLKTYTIVTSMDVKLSDIKALLRGRTVFEEEIAHFLDTHGGARRLLNDSAFLLRFVQKVEGWSEEPGNRSVHFGPDFAPRRGTSVRGSVEEYALAG